MHNDQNNESEGEEGNLDFCRNIIKTLSDGWKLPFLVKSHNAKIKQKMGQLRRVRAHKVS